MDAEAVPNKIQPPALPPRIRLPRILLAASRHRRVTAEVVVLVIMIIFSINLVYPLSQVLRDDSKNDEIHGFYRLGDMVFPRDEGRHEWAEDEWWYINCIIGTEDGRIYGLQTSYHMARGAAFQEKSLNLENGSGISRRDSGFGFAASGVLSIAFSGASTGEIFTDTFYSESNFSYRWNAAFSDQGAAVMEYFFNLSLHVIEYPVFLPPGWDDFGFKGYMVPRLVVNGTMKIGSSNHSVEGVGFMKHVWSFSQFNQSYGWFFFSSGEDFMGEDSTRGTALFIYDQDKRNFSFNNGVVLEPEYKLMEDGALIVTSYEDEQADERITIWKVGLARPDTSFSMTSQGWGSMVENTYGFSRINVRVRGTDTQGYAFCISYGDKVSNKVSNNESKL